MAKITELDWKPDGCGGERAIICFTNGYAASCLRGDPRNGTYEIAVLRGGKLDCTTPVTDDVCGDLTEDEANETLAAIESLPAASSK